MTQKEDKYNIKIKDYPDGSRTVIYYDTTIIRGRKRELWNNEVPLTPLEEIQEKSISRTMKMINDYSRSNLWEYFCTWTFNKIEVNRYDYDACMKKVKTWIDKIRRDNPDMRYLIVPEQHKDGAWHLHGLMSGANLKLKDSGRYTALNDHIYNVEDYNSGFTTVTRIKDSQRASSYIKKYITKDVVNKTKNKRRYFNSKNLELPYERTEYSDDYYKLYLKAKEKADYTYEKTIPGMDGLKVYYLEFNSAKSKTKNNVSLNKN